MWQSDPKVRSVILLTINMLLIATLITVILIWFALRFNALAVFSIGLTAIGILFVAYNQIFLRIASSRKRKPKDMQEVLEYAIGMQEDVEVLIDYPREDEANSENTQGS